jgi:2-deoxy-D-gluconate 3-dehydrogenase
MHDLFSVKNKRIVITGGRRGLGWAMAKALAEGGACVSIISKNHCSSDQLTQLKDLGGMGYSFAADLAVEEQREKIIDLISEKVGGIDILINNAGTQTKASIENYTLEMFRKEQELLVNAVFDLSRQASTHFKNQGHGKIINISSISGFQGARNIIGYSTSKHAIIGLTKCLSNELAMHNINVNSLAPGLFITELSSETTSDQSKSMELLGRIPSGRFGKPEDIVGPVLFLCSDASRHISGVTIPVDGGWLGR